MKNWKEIVRGNRFFVWVCSMLIMSFRCWTFFIEFFGSMKNVMKHPVYQFGIYWTKHLNYSHLSHLHSIFLEGFMLKLTCNPIHYIHLHEVQVVQSEEYMYQGRPVGQSFFIELFPMINDAQCYQALHNLYQNWWQCISYPSKNVQRFGRQTERRPGNNDKVLQGLETKTKCLKNRPLYLPSE